VSGARCSFKFHLRASTASSTVRCVLQPIERAVVTVSVVVLS